MSLDWSLKLTESEQDILTLTTEIVASYLGNSAHINPSEIPGLIRSVRAALAEDPVPAVTEEPQTKKATKGQISKSIQPHGLTSFLDGKVYKTLKRHLTRHGHTMESYKAAYGLPSDYPSVSSEYSAARSAMAKNLGLGARGRAAAEAPPAKGSGPKKGRAKAKPVGES